ncbi:hypothetical protein ACGFRG_08695 [Streptomyces sp. NPDC048696]|uniref:hypothetical protein n=1 Tax=Streptomyces sp. NPDC048696 TaxID=3365585 RepID=UPI0037201F53
MNTALAAAAAGPSLAVTVPILLMLLTAGIVMCTYIGHRWSTLIVGVLIGVYLSGSFAESTKSVVSQVVTAAVSGLSNAVG